MLIGTPNRPALPDPPHVFDNLEEIRKYLVQMQQAVNVYISSITASSIGIIGVRGFSSYGVVSENFVGSVTIQGTATAAVVTLMNIEHDTSYMVLTNVHPGVGSPLNFTSTWQSPKTTSFVAVISGAPGTSNSVVINWELLR